MSSIYNIRPTIPSGSKTISYSQFSLYSECPWKWKLMYVDKHKPSDPSIHLTFGTSFHETLQHYLQVVFEKSVKEADSIDFGAYLRDRMSYNYKITLAQNKGLHYSNRTQLNEFHQDGVAILNFIRKKRTEYFPTQHYKLLGVEIPLLERIGNTNVFLNGYIDLVILDERDNLITIYDIKTSTKGWTDKEKKDENKKAQIIIYKEYFAKQFNLPVDNIEVVFFIVRRKLWEEAQYPQKRVQLFTPPSGKVTRKKVNAKLLEFVDKAFDASGQYKTDVQHNAIAGDNDKNCKWCIFKTNYTLCPKENRLYY